MVHPSIDDLEQYRTRRLDPGELLRIDDHVSACAACQGRMLGNEQVAELVSGLKAQLEQSMQESEPSWKLPAWVGLAAAVLVAVALASWLVLRQDTANPGTARGGPSSPSATARGSELPGAAALVVALSDAPGKVGLDSAGRLSVPMSLPAALASAVQSALSTGRLALDPRVLALVAGRGHQRGSDDVARFALLAPIATAVESGRPAFRWRPVTAASSYVVTVSDASFRQVATSGPITRAEWRPDTPLPSGRSYVWQVTAYTAAGEETAPAADDPQAQFLILDEQRQAQLASVRARAAGSHLALGVLYATEGLFDEADAELASFVALNQGAPRARALLDDLRLRRGLVHAPPAPTTANPAQ